MQGYRTRQKPRNQCFQDQGLRRYWRSQKRLWETNGQVLRKQIQTWATDKRERSQIQSTSNWDEQQSSKNQRVGSISILIWKQQKEGNGPKVELLGYDSRFGNSNCQHVEYHCSAANVVWKAELVEENGKGWNVLSAVKLSAHYQSDCVLTQEV